MVILRTFVVVMSLLNARADVTMLEPGFTVTELPVKISNINNLRFRDDGVLTALGYDGRIHLLRDTNGDGLEDSDTLFWDKSTLSVPVGMVWGTNGLYVSSHGKVSLLRDTNGDGQADVEEIVASGWPATDVGSGGVDATAVTLDSAGNLYFGLLVADYSNPYRVKDGVSHYERNGPRGTIQKLNATTKALETIATGIRVPYALAFNRNGDLFNTDQEGETWCPNGNPLDEFNLIIPGRNYGFPPRDDKYLPDLISEPPIVAFGPQHQSSCGFVFNEPSAKQKLFGPKWWEGDAFVAGESRGKIWRVHLVKTPAGYIGREFLIARLTMLTTDVAISPKGDLYVSCHSGEPDWGTGPQGMGKIYKISYTDPKAPQAVAIWPSDLLEVTVAFDKPIDSSITNHVAEMSIEFGDYVAAADQLEKLKPPYKVVSYQESTPRGKLRVHAATLAENGRILKLTTDPHSQSVRYALRIPGYDLAYNLSGTEAAWTAPDKTIKWRGWLPHFDPAVNEAFAGLSAEHAKLAELMKRDGVLTFRSYVDLPGVNPRIEADVENSTTHRETDGRQLFAVSIKTPITRPLKFSYKNEIDPTPRQLPLDAFLLLWAPLRKPPLPQPEKETQITGGDFERGREIFFSADRKCSTCHRLRGEGATVGPDLSNLSHRDPAAVLRDIQDPSAAINPDYVAYNVVLKNGDEPSGFVRAQNTEGLRFLGIDGKERIFKHDEISGLRVSSVSLMPAGLLQGLSDHDVRSLLTFLVSAPPSRTAADVEKYLAPVQAPARAPKTVLVASKQDHGPGQHDYPAWQKKWCALLNADTAFDWPSDEQWNTADVMVFYFWNHDWSDTRLAQLDAFQNRGGGIVMFHAACIADKEPEKLAERIGLSAQPNISKYLHTPFQLKFVAPTNHPLALKRIEMPLLDEPYWPLIGDTNRVQVLATGEIEAQARPLIWTFQRNKGRVFVSIPGHYTWTFDDPVFGALVRRAIAWVAPAIE